MTSEEALELTDQMTTVFGVIQSLAIFLAPINGIIIDQVLSKTSNKYLAILISATCCNVLGVTFSFLEVVSQKLIFNADESKMTECSEAKSAKQSFASKVVNEFFFDAKLRFAL